ncbi:M28 family peptidase [Candidatus Bathyarchaeota archaeon]|nr:M28 family peptidase [Candidatus Bathyarchaeota archaeon]
MSMSFHENQLDMMQVITDLSYPRYSGTKANEEKCKEYLIEQYKRFGLEPVVEMAQWNTFSTNVLLRVIVGIIFSGIVTGVVLHLLDLVWVTIIFISALIASLIIAVNTQQNKIDAFATMGNVQETYNMHALLPSTKKVQDAKVRDVLFVAHHDTKSQKVTTLVRTSSYVLGFLLSIILGLLMIITSILKLLEVAPNFTSGMDIVLIVLLAIDVVPLSILLYNKSIKGESLGSLDNATAIAILLKLMEHYAQEPERGVNLWFVITGAEEHGMCGAIAFWKRHHDELQELDPNTTAVFNYDMVAGGVTFIEHFGFPKAPYNSYLNSMIKDSAKANDIQVHGFWLPMLGTTDGWIFRLNGCDTADIVTKSMARYTHSKLDTPELCDRETLDQAVTITIDVVGKLEKKNEE